MAAYFSSEAHRSGIPDSVKLAPLVLFAAGCFNLY